MLEDADDRKRYAELEAPKAIVVRYGYDKLIAELPYDGEDKPGCGSKIVIRTERGIELSEMLTTTCPNAGCGSAVSRKDMLQYIDNSGGKNFPFTTKGRVLRVATADDVIEQNKLDEDKPRLVRMCKQFIKELDLDMRLVEVEPLLGGERVIFHYAAEERVDFRELVKRLAGALHTRIEMHQVTDREEARLTADYNKCGQYCCCKNFLKVLKPISMRSAKVQKATLDPQKISGRCGRLMCCLRYEDATYEQLRKNLPYRNTRVITEDGPGKVVSTQILTQLALVRIEGIRAPQAYPVENITIMDKQAAKEMDRQERERQQQRDEGGRDNKPRGRGQRDSQPRANAQDNRPHDQNQPSTGEASQEDTGKAQADASETKPPQTDDEKSKPNHRTKPKSDGGSASGYSNDDVKPKRRRRRRRRGRGGKGKGGESGGGGDSGGSGSDG